MTAAAGSANVSLSSRPWWPWVKRAVTWLFLVAVAWLVVRYARTIDWGDVLEALRSLPGSAISIALVLVASSHVLYSTFDLLGRAMTGHRLGPGTVMGVTFVCYAFNLNLGSIVGSVALRYRLYSRLGLDNVTITRVMGMSMLTNWLGYLVLAGTLFCFGLVHLPPDWKIDDAGLRVVGAALLLAAIAYVILCAVTGHRTWTVRGHEIETPSPRMAVLQIVMAAANWSLMGGIVWVLMRQAVPYSQVLAVLLVAAFAGLVTHVPAGLGVLEAVFVALLGDVVPPAKLVAALLAYRALFYLLPLAVASVFYLVTELRAKKLARESNDR